MWMFSENADRSLTVASQEYGSDKYWPLGVDAEVYMHPHNHDWSLVHTPFATVIPNRERGYLYPVVRWVPPCG